MSGFTSIYVTGGGGGGGGGDITGVTAGTGLTGGGTSGNVSLAINTSVVAQLAGSTFTGAVVCQGGLSGSLNKLSDGSNYLLAGSNITLTTGSNGAVTIAASGGGTPGGENNSVQFNKSSALSGSNNFVYDYSTNRLGLGTASPSYLLDIQGTQRVNGGLILTGTLNLKGSAIPDQDFTYTLGTPELRWQHVYTGDLHLRNERGDWTIFEEPDYLCVQNNKTGQKFKMVLEPLK